MKNNLEEPANSTSIRLARTMVHDMGSPLTSIGGFAQLMLRDDSINGESREFLDIIANEAVKINEILANFLSDMEKEAGETE